MEEYDKWILNSDQAICMNLDSGDFMDRGFLSVNILGQLRNLLDNVCVKIFLLRGGRREQVYYNNIVNAKPWVAARYGFIKSLNKLLQISASHYTCDPESSERLMLKYYAYLLKLKKLMADEYDTRILHNLSKFPLDTDPAFSIYHEAIAKEIDTIDMARAITEEKRFYIYRARPFFVNGEIYYEVTFSLANEWVSKFDRMIAFTKIDILPNYASFMRITSTRISVFGVLMPIMIIVDWRPAIRICEFRNLARIVGTQCPNSPTREYRNLMELIGRYQCSLTDMMDFDDSQFGTLLSQVMSGGKTHQLSKFLIACRKLISKGKDGAIVLKYLMLRMSNKIIKSQYNAEQCRTLSRLHLKWTCKPFDCKPFYFSLPDHNPMLSDLLDCIPAAGRESELLARRLVGNAEHSGMMYTPVDELACFGDIDQLAEEQEAIDFLNWFCDLPYAHKVFICGNHDDCLYGANIDGLDPNVHYLCNSGIVIEGIRFFGVPMFMGDCVTERQVRNIADIPSDTDVLITHNPAFGILDLDDDINYGDEQLLNKVMEIHPRLHLFGHIHSNHGVATEHGITFSNGAIMNAGYTTLNLPNIIEI